MFTYATILTGSLIILSRELSVARGRIVLKSKVKDIQSMRRTQGEAADLKMEGATRRV